MSLYSENTKLYKKLTSNIRKVIKFKNAVMKFKEDSNFYDGKINFKITKKDFNKLSRCKDIIEF